MIEKRIKIVFTEAVLGTTSANPELFREFIASKNPDGVADDEIEFSGVEAETEKQSTIFPKDEGVPFFWDYQIKGFFKDAQGMFNRVDDKEYIKLPAYKKVLDGLVFVYPRRILIILPEGTKIEWCERPLRASGPQGERVALARSEMVPAGSIIEFKVKLLKDDLGNYLDSWLDYGADRGIGQWRNSGKGTFSWSDVQNT